MVVSDGVEVFGWEGVSKVVSCAILPPEKVFDIDRIPPESVRGKYFKSSLIMC